MKSITRKIISFFFLLLGLTPLLIILFLDLQEAAIKHRMKEKLRTNSLQKVTLAENEVTWKDENEIWINGYLFDIQSSTLENGIFTFTGLYDEEETRLVKKRDETAGAGNEENKLLSQYIEWLQSPYENSVDEVVTFQHYSGNFTSFINSALTPLLRKVPTPPPRA